MNMTTLIILIPAAAVLISAAIQFGSHAMKLTTIREIIVDTLDWILAGFIIFLAPISIGFTAGMVAGLIRLGWQAGLKLFN